MTQELIERLEPCPFCGSTPSSRWMGCHENGDEGYWDITCPCGQAIAHEDDEETAIARWNTRDQSQSARIAELRAGIAVAKALIGCGQGDHPNAIIRESNINQAWHALELSLTKDSTSGRPKCGGSHKTGPGLGDCDGPPTPSRPHPHARDMIA